MIRQNGLVGGELGQRRIAILQTRHAEILAHLIRRKGGQPLLAPALREEPVDELQPIRDILERVAAAELSLAVFQTGVGARRLLDTAAEMGMSGVLGARLEAATVVARGPKPLSVLLSHGIRVDRRTSEPHTTAQLLPLLEDAAGRTVLVQHHGARNTALIDFLDDRSAAVLEAVTYHWALPDDLGPVHHFLDELEAGRVDATLFTSASQVENLFAIAKNGVGAEKLGSWLCERTLIASVGPSTTAALLERAISPAVEPSRPKMAPLVDALCLHYTRVIPQ